MRTTHVVFPVESQMSKMQTLHLQKKPQYKLKLLYVNIKSSSSLLFLLCCCKYFASDDYYINFQNPHWLPWE